MLRLVTPNISHPFRVMKLLGLFEALLVCGLNAAGPGSPALPSQSDLFTHLAKSHPRLLATDADFASLKQRIASDPQLAKWHEALRQEGRELLEQPPSTYEIPDGLRLLSTSRRVVARVYTLGLLYRLDKEPQYAARAWKELEAAADFPDWNPRHFLDTAEMTHAFAIGYDWLYDVWTPEQREKLRQAIVEKGFQPALKTYRAHNWWARARHNWNQVCNGGMGMGALALADVQPQVSAEILHSALSSLPLAMGEFSPDGAWAEGPGYWNYATSYNVVFLAGLQTALGTDFGLSDMPGFSQTGQFPIYLTGPIGRTFNYADGGDRAIRAPQMFWLTRQFQQPVYAWYEQQQARPAPLDLLWFTPGDAGPNSAHLPLDKYFRGAELVSLRSDWENAKALFAGFKAGDNKANHSHLDIGTFVFDALGARWAVDLGADDYNLPGYFGAKRWDYYRLRAEGQNTLVLNPGIGPDQDPKGAGRILRFDSRPGSALAVADLTGAYQAHAKKVWRGLHLIGRNELLIQDELETKAPAEIWWFMHTAAAIGIDEKGRTALLKQPGAELRAQILSPPDLRWQMMEAAPLPTSPHPARQAKNERTRKLSLHLTNATSTRIAVLLVPGGQRAEETPKLVPLNQWPEALN